MLRTCGDYVEDMLIFAQCSINILSNHRLVTSTPTSSTIQFVFPAVIPLWTGTFDHLRLIWIAIFNSATEQSFFAGAECRWTSLHVG